MVPAATPCGPAHWLTAVAPTRVPALRPLFWLRIARGILVSRIWKSDVGLGAGDASGDPFGLGLVLVPVLAPVLVPGPGDWGDVAATVLAGNGLRCATAATPRYPATSAIAAATPSVLRLNSRDPCGGRPDGPGGPPGGPGDPLGGRGGPPGGRGGPPGVEAPAPPGPCGGRPGPPGRP